MEIEAKFALPDVGTLRRLEQAERLAGFGLGAPRVERVQDLYLDTADRCLLASGYVFRRRQKAEGVLYTLKQLHVSPGPIQRREEFELLLPQALPLVHWPEGPLRSQVLHITQGAPLHSILSLRQKRIVRVLQDSARAVAQLSLDRVKVRTGGRRAAVLELEVELEPQGTEQELAQIARCLEDEWHLRPVTLSKFERALQSSGERPSSQQLLTPPERLALLRIARKRDRHGRRAIALLALDDGDTQKAAANRAGASDRALRYWLARFRETRLGLFPSSVLSAATQALPDEPAESTPAGKRVERAIVGGADHAPEAETADAQLVQLPSEPGLTADDSMAEAARKTFRFHLQRMEYREAGAREGKDIEELHDMRVATRRMRAAMAVFGDFLDRRQMKPYLKELRRTGRALGAVRDLDVFRQKMGDYLDILPPLQAHDLDPLLAAWQHQHESAREAMLAHLSSERYLRFKHEFGAFLQTPEAGALPVFTGTGEPIPHRLRHVVPLVIYQRVALVRVYENWVSEPNPPLQRLHQLRIACKGLRYALEFFREILGAEAESLIDTMKEVQDHLGDLQDAVVASNLLRDFLTWGTWGHQENQSACRPAEPIVAPGVATYLAARQREIQQLAESFPQVWSRIQNLKFHEQLVSATAVLW